MLSQYYPTLSTFVAIHDKFIKDCQKPIIDLVYKDKILATDEDTFSFHSWWRDETF